MTLIVGQVADHHVGVAHVGERGELRSDPIRAPDDAGRRVHPAIPAPEHRSGDRIRVGVVRADMMSRRIATTDGARPWASQRST